MQIASPEKIAIERKLSEIFTPKFGKQGQILINLNNEPDTPVEALVRRYAHYTSAEAALNIINNRYIWMRHTSVMADFREVEHGIEMQDDFFSTNDNLHRFIDAVRRCKPSAATYAFEHFNKNRGDIRNSIYVTSFSEHGKDENEHGRLSMWRAFGSTRSRVAIVFAFPWNTDVTEKLGIAFRPVIYADRSEVYANLNEVINNIEQNQEWLRDRDDAQLKSWIFTMLVSGVTCFKHKGFKEELEWRAVYIPKLGTSNLIEPCCHLVRGIPQKVFKLPLDVGDSLIFTKIVERVIIGPTSYPFVMKEVFADALSKAGVPDSENKVWASEIPLRDQS